ncbi:MAG: hypothetical protein P8R42_05760 [Candidatus Binatia bacterium]|nr:hypothetical protein [Candidatus Binatia bacterium]
MRFREDAVGVVPILTAVLADEPRGDGGRGVGFTGGHFHWNWGNDDFRTLVLNAIVWTAGAEVPADGVPSRAPGATELLALEPGSMTKRLDRWFGFDREEVIGQFDLADAAG